MLKALRHAAIACEGDYVPTGTGEAPVSDLLLEAAEEIERLRAALNEIRVCPDWYTATKIACRALETGAVQTPTPLARST